MGIEFRRRLPKGLRKHFRKNPGKRHEHFKKRGGKVLPEQGAQNFLIGGPGVQDIPANNRTAIRTKLKALGTHPKIVEVVLAVNDAVYTVRRDSARNYERANVNSYPVKIFMNLIVAGRKGDIEAVGILSKMYLQAGRSGRGWKK